MNGPQVFSVESFNSGIENEGVEDAEIIKGKRFADLANEILIADEAIVAILFIFIFIFLLPYNSAQFYESILRSIPNLKSHITS